MRSDHHGYIANKLPYCKYHQPVQHVISIVADGPQLNPRFCPRNVTSFGSGTRRGPRSKQICSKGFICLRHCWRRSEPIVQRRQGARSERDCLGTDAGRDGRKRNHTGAFLFRAAVLEFQADGPHFVMSRARWCSKPSPPIRESRSLWYSD